MIVPAPGDSLAIKVCGLVIAFFKNNSMPAPNQNNRTGAFHFPQARQWRQPLIFRLAKPIPFGILRSAPLCFLDIFASLTGFLTI